ncbi:hypothetical protein D043_3053A, partial [Vibrio parahaemolyticus EKP-021]
MLPTALIKPA